MSVNVSEFEKIREQISKEENGPDWQLAKTFEHTLVYRKSDNETILKVSWLLLNTVDTINDNLLSYMQYVCNLVGIPYEDCEL